MIVKIVFHQELIHSDIFKPKSGGSENLQKDLKNMPDWSLADLIIVCISNRFRII